MKRLGVHSIKGILDRLFLLLVVAAPFSFIPSLAAPVAGFSSFRFGLYQFAALLFCILVVYEVIKTKSFTRALISETVFRISLLIGFVVFMGLVDSVDIVRGMIMGVSILFLVALTWCVYWYVSSTKRSELFKIMLPILLKAAVFYGIVSVFQLLIAILTPENALLCKGCTSTVFGFPRINGFAAEPLFWGNALIPFLFVALHSYARQRSRLSMLALLGVSVSIGLTFSRGAFLAVAVGCVAYEVYSYGVRVVSYSAKLRSLGFMTLGFAVSFLLLIGSAVLLYKDAPYIAYNTARGMVEQLTLGAVNLPIKQEVSEELDVVAQSAEVPAENEFISEGLVEASTSDRTNSAKLALTAWNRPENYVFGVGAGNLGPYVVEAVESNAPRNLTVYIYYVLLLAELGIAGLLAVLSLYAVAYKRLWKDRSEVGLMGCAIITAFLVQYWFFGSTINVVYVWVWLGMALGLSGLHKKLPKSAILKHK